MKDNSEICFEKELWASADKLRGSMDSSGYNHIASKLTSDGKAGVVLANGSLPTQLFYSTQIPVYLWFLNKNKNIRKSILFIDIKEKVESIEYGI